MSSNNPNREANIAHTKELRLSKLNAKYDGISMRATARAMLTDAQQLSNLDFRLGKGEGAKRERAMLKKKIEEARK